MARTDTRFGADIYKCLVWRLAEELHLVLCKYHTWRTHAIANGLQVAAEHDYGRFAKCAESYAQYVRESREGVGDRSTSVQGHAHAMPCKALPQTDPEGPRGTR